MENSTPIAASRRPAVKPLPTLKSARRPTPAQRLRAMHDHLAAAYGPQSWWPAKTPFEVIVGAYLTQNTAWKAVERSLANLRSAGALTVEGLRAIPLQQLRELIRPSGFPTRKAPALKAFMAMLDADFGGSLDQMAAGVNRHAAAPAAGAARRRPGDRGCNPALRAGTRSTRCRRISAQNRRAP